VSPSAKRFVRHYAEMVAAMFIGMAVLGLPAGWAMSALGTSWGELHDTAPAVVFLVMAVTMTVPMVGWMAYRGHGARANAEMAASMLLPTFAAIGLLRAGLGDMGSLMLGEHVAMLLCMLGAMLLRPGEYACRPGESHAAAPAAGRVAA
jgi:hypothetical protein